MIWKSHDCQLQLIPKILIRGVSEWIKEEICYMCEKVEKITWVKEDEMLLSFLKSVPELTEEMFSTIVLKRNGTRLCLLILISFRGMH
mmetsp:Transcript_5062/g.5762  ORF Transcript_5062/g.5762 Transcript_5062/m.5762 type:complete len:88 (+) Transcript_5062:181-444(+)